MKTPLVSVYAKLVDFLLKKEDVYSYGCKRKNEVLRLARIS
jgi:hypothetical protein